MGLLFPILYMFLITNFFRAWNQNIDEEDMGSEDLWKMNEKQNNQTYSLMWKKNEMTFLSESKLANEFSYRI
jgi:hypothetical protein